MKIIQNHIESLFFMFVLAFSSCIMSCDPNSTNNEEDSFHRNLEILKKNDQCTIEDQDLYNDKNTFFYPLSATENNKLLLVETMIGCDFTGSCGNRIMVIKDDSVIVYHYCGFFDKLIKNDSAQVSSFYLLERGYQTGELKSIVSWDGTQFHSEVISRNNIAVEVLDTLSSHLGCFKKDFYWGCFATSSVKVDTVLLNSSGNIGLLVTVPMSVLENSPSKYSETYWLFKIAGNGKCELLNTFYEVNSILFQKEEINGYYKITINQYRISENHVEGPFNAEYHIDSSGNYKLATIIDDNEK